MKTERMDRAAVVANCLMEGIGMVVPIRNAAKSVNDVSVIAGPACWRDADIRSVIES